MGDTLYDEAALLLRERDRRESMTRALTSMAVADAGEKIYKTLSELLEQRARP